MSSFGQVQLSRVWKMLKKCAEDYAAIEQPHSWRIEYDGKVYPNFPLGKRSKATPEIELGHVRKMVRHLGLDPQCVRKHLPQLSSLK